MESIPSQFLFGTRLLVFVEVASHTNKYRQVLLSPQEFKRMSMSIGTVLGQAGAEQTVELRMSDEIFDLPDLSEING